MATFETFTDNASDLFFDWARAKLSPQVRPPAPAPTPAPVYLPVSTAVPEPARAAQGSDIGQQLGEIFSSPRTWLALSAVALVVVMVRLRG